MSTPSIDQGDRSSGIASALPLVGLAIACALVLAWFDLLPGGYRLRGLFEPHAERHAREFAAHAAERLRRFQAEDAGVRDGAIVFLGSSTIERFPLAEVFPAKACVNRGIADESALQLLQDLDGRLPPVHLAGIVLYTGGIDWRENERDPRLMVERVAAVLTELARRQPGVPILLLGILPERGLQPEGAVRLKLANVQLATLASERGIAFLDVAVPPLARLDGALDEALSSDQLHLDARGYRELARLLMRDGGQVGKLLAP